jgi:uncharacterized membrane protein YfcA
VLSDHGGGRRLAGAAQHPHIVNRRDRPADRAGLAIGGIPAVFVAAFLVKSMPLETAALAGIVVVLYAAAVMARRHMGRREAAARAATAHGRGLTIPPLAAAETARYQRANSALGPS